MRAGSGGSPLEQGRSVDALLFDPRADDPKIARPRDADPGRPAARGATPPRQHVAPVVQLAYRRLTVDGTDGADLTLHAAELDIYPISMRWLRLGVEIELGIGSGSTGAYFGLAGLSAGLQYPWRVTPFVEARAAGGVIGATVMAHSLVSYGFAAGVDAGLALYVVDRLFVSVAVGWTRFGYRGIDVRALRERPSADPVGVDIRSDALTLKVGFGL